MLIFYQLYKIYEARSAVFWSAAYFSFMLAFFLFSLFQPLYQLLGFWLYLIASYLILQGLYVFFKEKPLKIIYLISLAVVFISGIGFFTMQTNPFFYLSIPALIGFYFLASAWLIYKNRAFNGGMFLVFGGTILAGSLFFLSVFNIDLVLTMLYQALSLLAGFTISLGLLIATLQVNYKKLTTLQQAQANQTKSLEKRKEQIKQLHNFPLILSKLKHEDEICQATVKTAQEILHYDYSLVGLAQGDYFVYKGATPNITRQKKPINQGIMGITFREQKSFLNQDLQQNPFVEKGNPGYRSGISVPVGEFGVFQAMSQQVGFFTAEELEISELLISHTIAALNRVKSSNLLKVSQERNLALLSAMPDLMFIVNQELKIIDYYVDSEDKLLKSPAEFLNHELSTILSPVEAEFFAQKVTSVFETGLMSEFEYSFDFGDNERFFEIRLVRSGREIVLAIVRDITDSKIARKSIEETKLKLEKMHDITLKMSSADDEDTVYALMIKGAEDILGYDLCTVDMVEGDYFVVKATSVAMPKDGSQNMKVTEGIAGKSFQTGKTLLIDDLWNEDDGKPIKPSYRALLSTPIGSLGIFQATSTQQRTFSDEDISLTEILASHTAEALKRIFSEKNMRYMSFHDALTGIFNRSFLEQELTRLDTIRQLPISIIIGDINGLKLINDAYGHAAGDKLLKKAADVLKLVCRTEDIIGRWGGDEFVIVLPHTKLNEANKIINRIQGEAQGIFIESIPLSMALGVASKNNHGEEIYEVLAEAEKKMYRNKLAESRSARSAVLNSLRNTLAEKSQETEEHTTRMEVMALKLGKKLGLMQEELNRLSLLVSLHDVGKILIAEEILNKPGKLSAKEWEIIRSHPETGYRIARSIEEISHVAEEILAHHERWDGKGYPHGLKGKEIPLLARINAIVDAFDVMTNSRPYKREMTKEQAIIELKRCAGTQFDPQLTQVFLELLQTED